MTFLNRKKYYSLSDEELLNLFKKEQLSICIDVIYDRYGYLLFAIATKYLKNKQDAEDVVMSLFQILGSKLLKHDIQNFKSWLQTTIRNECLMKLRKKKSIEFGIVDSDLKVDSSQDEMDFLIEKEIIYDNLHLAIDSLKPEQKRPIELFYIENKSYVEIADIMHVSVNQVKSAIQNGKRMLRIKLEKQVLQKNEIK